MKDWKDGELPEGWEAKEVRFNGLEYIEVGHLSRGFVTIDVERRALRPGLSTTGPTISTGTVYLGRGWRDRLWADAVKQLVDLHDTKGTP